MKRVLLLCVLLVAFPSFAFRPTLTAGGGSAAAPAGGCGSGDNCAPGSEALTFNAATDIARADTNAAVDKGHFACVYFRPTSAPGSQVHVVMGLDDGTSTQWAGWPASTGTSNPGFYVADTTNGSAYTMQTTNIYASCFLFADGTGETESGRMWLWEQTGADVWTEITQGDILKTSPDLIGAVADAAFYLADGANSVAPNPFLTYYAWVIEADFGINPSDAAAQTEMEKYLGCSIDPGAANVVQVWSMTDTSTSSEPNEVGSGTAMALTNVTRTNGSPIWTDGGGGEAAECDL